MIGANPFPLLEPSELGLGSLSISGMFCRMPLPVTHFCTRLATPYQSSKTPFSLSMPYQPLTTPFSQGIDDLKKCRDCLQSKHTACTLTKQHMSCMQMYNTAPLNVGSKVVDAQHISDAAAGCCSKCVGCVVVRGSSQHWVCSPAAVSLGLGVCCCSSCTAVLLLLQHIGDCQGVREVWPGSHHASRHLQRVHHLQPHMQHQRSLLLASQRSILHTTQGPGPQEPCSSGLEVSSRTTQELAIADSLTGTCLCVAGPPTSSPPQTFRHTH